MSTGSQTFGRIEAFGKDVALGLIVDDPINYNLFADFCCVVLKENGKFPLQPPF